jgi:hypothetical protein
MAYLTVLSHYLHGYSQENHVRSQESRFLGRESSPEPLEYEAVLLSTRPRCQCIRFQKLKYYLFLSLISGYFYNVQFHCYVEDLQKLLLILRWL